MERQLAYVLGGGGARGALQVGAIRALLEAGVRPNLLVGTSIGAVNAAFLAFHGVSLQGVERLTEACAGFCECGPAALELPVADRARPLQATDRSSGTQDAGIFPFSRNDTRA